MNARILNLVTVRDISIILLLGMIGSFLLIRSSQMGGKWLVFLLSIPLGASLILILPSAQKYLFSLFMMIFFVPIHLDYHPIYFETSVILPVVGLSISMWEIPFFYLLFSWTIRQIFIVRPNIDLFPAVTIPFLLIWIVALVGMGRCLYPDLIKFTIMAKFLESWFVFVYLGNTLNDKDDTILFVAYAFLSTVVVQTIVGFLQQFAGGLLGLEVFGENAGFVNALAGYYELGRVGGTLGSPNSLSVYLVSVLPFGFALLFAPIKPAIKRLFVLPACVMGVLLLIITYSRAGWIGLLAGSGLTIFLCRVRKTKQAFGTFLVLTSALVIFVVSLIVFVEPIRNRLFEDDNNAAGIRIPMAMVAAAMIYKNPFWGVGLANYTSVANQYDFTPDAVTYKFPWPVHNEFLLVASELGIPALLLLLFLIMYVVIKLLRVGRSPTESTTPYIALGLVGSLIGYCINRLFDFDYIFITNDVWIRFGMALAVIKAGWMTLSAKSSKSS